LGTPVKGKMNKKPRQKRSHKQLFHGETANGKKTWPAKSPGKKEGSQPCAEPSVKSLQRDQLHPRGQSSILTRGLRFKSIGTGSKRETWESTVRFRTNRAPSAGLSSGTNKEKQDETASWRKRKGRGRKGVSRRRGQKNPKPS